MNTNILLLSAGRRVKLYHILQEELALLFPNAIVIAADANPAFSSVCAIASSFVELPFTTDANFGFALASVCNEMNIGLIIPTTDFDANALAIALEESNIPTSTQILGSSKEFVLKCQDKVLTCTIFKEANVNFLMPLAPEDFEFPLFMKPRYGYSSEDCRIIEEEGDLPKSILELEDFGDYIFQYYLPPNEFQEYSIDCYYNLKSTLLCAVPRKRISTRGGEVSKSMTQKNEVYTWVWENFSSLNGATGPITLQCFLNLKTKDVVAGEINPRLAGGYTLSHAAGANFVKYALEEYLLKKTILPTENWKENVLMLRFDDEIIKQTGQ